MGAVSAAIALVYVAPITLPYLATSDPASAWQSGHFVVIARELGGPRLEAWVLVACVGTNMQMFASALQSAMFTCQGMAKLGIFPEWLAKSSESGIPRRALCTCALGGLLFGFLPLMVNLSIEGILFIAIMLVEMLCFLRMDASGSQRLSTPVDAWMVPHLHRPSPRVISRHSPSPPVAAGRCLSTLAVARRRLSTPVDACRRLDGATFTPPITACHFAPQPVAAGRCRAVLVDARRRSQTPVAARAAGARVAAEAADGAREAAAGDLGKRTYTI